MMNEWKGSNKKRRRVFRDKKKYKIGKRMAKSFVVMKSSLVITVVALMTGEVQGETDEAYNIKLKKMIFHTHNIFFFLFSCRRQQ